jgi:tetratricopeptide (TPR) repeat protein
MRWQQAEFILKGIYLGLLLFVGLILREHSGWEVIGQIGLTTFVTLAICLGIAGVRKLREGYKVRGRPAAFVLFLLLESPGLVYAGVLLGMLLGAFWLLSSMTAERAEELDLDLLYCVLGGAALGVLFNVLYHVRDRRVRLWAFAALGAALIAGGIYGVSEIAPAGEGRILFAVLLLLGIPLFYLLTLASMTEESEVEIMAICAALGLSLWIFAEHWLAGNGPVPLVVLLVPLLLYYIYTRSILPELRVFKHVLRGLSYANVGQFRPALLSLGRALQLKPSHPVAREQIWHVHRMMDYTEVVNDPATLSLLNFELCLERVAQLLLADKPRPEQLHEAQRLLDLVASQRPNMMPRCDYWRAVALTHEKRYEEAATALERVLSDGNDDNKNRQAILFPAWQLALMLHPEMTRRVGTPQLAIPGRRMQAIAAVERRLVDAADDAAAWDLKRVLYNDLTEAEFQTHVVQGKPPSAFDYAYVQQLGQALCDDPAQVQRCSEYLRMAAAGMPEKAPTIYLTIARTEEKAGNFAAVWQAYEAIKQAVPAVGPKNLAAQDRHTYYAVLKALGDDAAKRGDTVGAIENFRLFAEYERAGINTYRTLAELYERQGDAWGALHATEQGMVYDATDADLLARKDRYYYSVMPQELEPRREQVQKWFDVDYCKRKARWLLDHQGEDLELLDWADHLTQLALVMEPAGLAARVLKARVLRRRGEVDQAIAVLEEIRTNRPERFRDSDEEDAWFLTCRMLGDLYLNSKPDQAILCFQEYRKHGKSGADTVYKMGVAYENLGDFARAKKCYEMVVSYEGHPLKPEASSALYRLQASP